MNSNEKKPYISCMKLNGIPILPPVITTDLRKELLSYKHQAVKLEKRLSKFRDLKKNLNELLGTPEENIRTRPSSQLTFSDSSHIEALNICDKPKKLQDLQKPHLSRDIIEVTQYDDNGMKTICSNISLRSIEDTIENDHDCDSIKIDNNSSSATSMSTIYVELNTDEQNNKSNGERSRYYYDNEFSKPATPPKPRLIRSNSYTLESPSPILLAHLQKNSLDIKTTDGNSLVAARNWTSLENNHTSFESSVFGSADTVYHKESSDKNKGDNIESSKSPNKSVKVINEVKSPTIEVYQTDISVQQITVNTVGDSGLTKEEKSEKFLSRDPFEVFEPDCELMNVLKDIPEVYANQILDLLKMQHSEQKERLDRYDTLNNSPQKSVPNTEVFRSQSSSQKFVNDDVQKSISRNSDDTIATLSNVSTAHNSVIDIFTRPNDNSAETVPRNNNEFERPQTTESCTNSDRPASDKLRRSSTFSMSPSQSLYYSISSDADSFTIPSSPSIKLIDLESNNGEDMEIGILREKNGYWEGVMKHENIKNINCTRELFPEFDPVTINALRKECAASVIGAHVKGYLTRRLLKTDKVQGLIATIKDVLVCAVELHQADNIDEKDVELHRRLINQLSAALYAFHDTFFDLSTPDQMLIIAADRQRKLEKLKRPQSSKSLSRSASNHSSNSIKSNKSLNSSRSASKYRSSSGPPSLTKV